MEATARPGSGQTGGTTASGQAGVEATAVASALQAGVQATEAGRTRVNGCDRGGTDGSGGDSGGSDIGGTDPTGVDGGDSGAVETRPLWGRREWRRHRLGRRWWKRQLCGGDSGGTDIREWRQHRRDSREKRRQRRDSRELMEATATGVEGGWRWRREIQMVAACASCPAFPPVNKCWNSSTFVR